MSNSTTTLNLERALVAKIEPTTDDVFMTIQIIAVDNKFRLYAYTVPAPPSRHTNPVEGFHGTEFSVLTDAKIAVQKYLEQTNIQPIATIDFYESDSLEDQENQLMVLIGTLEERLSILGNEKEHKSQLLEALANLYNKGRAYHALSGLKTVPAGAIVEIRLGVAYILNHPMLRNNQYLLTRFDLGDHGLIFVHSGEFDKTSGVGSVLGGLVPDPGMIISGTQEMIEMNDAHVVSFIDATNLHKNSNEIAYLLSHVGLLMDQINKTTIR